MDTTKFFEILTHTCKLDFTKRVVAGVSGGPDSLCMLDLLVKAGLPVIVVHVNHQLRPEADLEAEAVTEYCKIHQIESIVYTEDVEAFSRARKLSVEEGARLYRYSRLFETAEKKNAQAVLVAHNADDQAETVLMHFLRGSGLSGLKGMQPRTLQPQWHASIPLCRPLLFTGRQEILAYCDQNGLKPNIDSSNQDVRYFRNRIRQELLPELATYNPQIREHLVNMAEIVQAEDDFLTRQTWSAWQAGLMVNGEGFLLFNRRKIEDFHPALVKRLVRQAIHQIDPDLRDIDHGVVTRACEFLAQDKGANHLALCSDIEVVKYRSDGVILCHKADPLMDLWPQINAEEERSISVPGEILLSDRWKLTVQELADVGQFQQGSDVAIFDADQVGKLLLSTCKPGDRFAPFGMGGKSIKLGDYWTNQKLPVRARKNWPLVRDLKGEILWVVGMQTSENWKVTSQTKKTLRFKLEKS